MRRAHRGAWHHIGTALPPVGDISEHHQSHEQGPVPARFSPCTVTQPQTPSQMQRKSWPESEIFPKAALEPIGTAAAHSPGEMLLPLIAAGQVLKHGNEAGYG